MVRYPSISLSLRVLTSGRVRRFYNCTYAVFAASMILVYVTQEAGEAQAHSLLKLVAMAIEILETMDECVVALKAARLLQKAMEKAERKSSIAVSIQTPSDYSGDTMLLPNYYWGPFGFEGSGMDLDVPSQLADLNGTNSLFLALGDMPQL